MRYYISPEKRYGNQFYDFAKSFQKIAIEIDEKPEHISNYIDLSGINYMLHDRNKSAHERVQYFEALSYGDPGVILASPGPSLSGLLLQELGTKEQVDLFYTTIQHNKMHTFFGLTEPNKGSDANNIESTLCRVSENQYSLCGTKSFFGNGAVGKTGVLFAKIAPGPLGVRAVWMTPEILSNSNIKKLTLPLFGLRGAQIAAMEFNDVLIPHENILGQHLSACENGMLGIMKVFHRLRAGIGAMAIGQAQMVYDAFYLQYHQNTTLNSLFSQLHFDLETARNLLRSAALEVDQNSLKSTLVSIAKTVATHTAEKVISACINEFKINTLLENPLILKAYRDVFCWEFMEGTSTIQKIVIARSIEQKVTEIKLNLTGERI